MADLAGCFITSLVVAATLCAPVGGEKASAAVWRANDTPLAGLCFPADWVLVLLALGRPRKGVRGEGFSSLGSF